VSRWRVRFEERAARQLFKLGTVHRKRVRSFIDNRVLANGNPRTLGKALAGALDDLWSYRVGGVRILARIEDDILVVLVVEVGNRREVYR